MQVTPYTHNSSAPKNQGQPTIKKKLIFKDVTYDFNILTSIKFSDFLALVETQCCRKGEKIDTLLFIMEDGDYIEIYDEASWQLIKNRPKLVSFKLNLKMDKQDKFTDTPTLVNEMPEAKQQTLPVITKSEAVSAILQEGKSYKLSERTLVFLDSINSLFRQVDINSKMPLCSLLYPLGESELELKHKNSISRYQKKKLSQQELAEYRELVNHFEIEVWVNHIVQMFSIKDKPYHATHLEKNLVQQIVNFLDTLQELPVELRGLLLNDEKALNSILLSLLLCKNKEKWIKTIDMIKKESLIEVSQLHHLLDWAYASFINHDNEQSSLLLKEISNSGFEKLLTPLHIIFYFIFEGEKNTSDIQKLIEISYTGFCTCSYTFYSQPLVKEAYFKVIEKFITLYIKTPMEHLSALDDRLPIMLNLAFRLFISRLGSEKIDYAQADVLISFLEHNPDLVNNSGDASAPGVILSLARSCFDDSHYKRAGQLYTFVKTLDTNTEGPYKAALYDLFYRLELWLATDDGPLHADLMTLLVDKIFKYDEKIKAKIYLTGDVQKKLVNFGDRILKRLEQHIKDKQAQIIESQLEHIIRLLGSGRGQTLQRKLSDLKRANLRKEPLKTIDLSWLEEKKPRKRTVLNNKQVKTRMNNLPEEEISPIVMQPESPVEQSVPEKKLNVVSKKPTFFSEKSLPESHDKWLIDSKTLPDTLKSLATVIQSNYTDFKVFLTGGAILSLITQKKPNDYDLVVLKSVDSKESLYEMQKTLLDTTLKCEVRGSLHQILHCILSDGSKVDITLVHRKPKQSIESCLRADALIRDFNIGAMYLPLGTKDEQLQVISYFEILNNKTPALIKVIHEKPDGLFYDDPSRVLRLAHLLLQHPEYALDNALQKQLSEMKDQWPAVLKKYTQQLPNKSRMSHAIRKLFSRYSIEQLNSVFDTLDFLPALSNRSRKDIQQASLLIPKNIEDQYKLIAWLIAIVQFDRKKHTKVPPQPVFNFIVWNQMEQLWVNHLIHKGEKPSEPQALVSLIDNLVTDESNQIQRKMK